MDHIEIAVSGLLIPVITYLWWVFRRMQVKIDNTYSKSEVRQLVEDKLEPTAVEIRLLANNLEKIDNKLDKLIQLNLRND